MRIGFITLQVASLDQAEAFYSSCLGLKPTRRFAATKWISFDVHEEGGAGFGVIESADVKFVPSAGTVDIYVKDLDQLWGKINGKCEVISAPERTDWGSYKAVILDPSGNRIGLVQEVS